MPTNNYNITGLSSNKVLEAREKFGTNELKFKKENGFWDALKNLIKEPMLILLLMERFISDSRRLSGGYDPSDGDVSITADKILFKNNVWSTQENIELNLSTNFRGAGTYSKYTYQGHHRSCLFIL